MLLLFFIRIQIRFLEVKERKNPKMPPAFMCIRVPVRGAGTFYALAWDGYGTVFKNIYRTYLF